MYVFFSFQSITKRTKFISVSRLLWTKCISPFDALFYIYKCLLFCILSIYKTADHPALCYKTPYMQKPTRRQTQINSQEQFRAVRQRWQYWKHTHTQRKRITWSWFKLNTQKWYTQKTQHTYTVWCQLSLERKNTHTHTALQYHTSKTTPHYTHTI